jgi:hypothetical protein
MGGIREEKEVMDGLTGNVYEISVLPNTIEELVIAIYDQKGKDKVSRADALDMAAYLDKAIKDGTYGGNVPTNLFERKQK